MTSRRALPPCPSNLICSSSRFVFIQRHPTHEVYYNQDGRGSDTATVSRACDSVPRASPSTSTSISKLTPTPTPASTPAKTGAATNPETSPETSPKTSIRPLDRKAYLAGREVIRKIQDKLQREVVSHSGHLKRVRAVQSEGERERMPVCRLSYPILS